MDDKYLFPQSSLTNNLEAEISTGIKASNTTSRSKGAANANTATVTGEQIAREVIFFEGMSKKEVLINIFIIEGEPRFEKLSVR